MRDGLSKSTTDMDNYTEVLEELYEKYKDKGGNLPPEIRFY